jgi:hypothetical protein
MSENAPEEIASAVRRIDVDSGNGEQAQIPTGVVTAAEQLNGGESVSKDEMMDALEAVTDSED